MAKKPKSLREQWTEAKATAKAAGVDMAKVASKDNLGPLLDTYEKKKKAYDDLPGTAEAKKEAAAKKAYHDAAKAAAKVAAGYGQSLVQIRKNSIGATKTAAADLAEHLTGLVAELRV